MNRFFRLLDDMHVKGRWHLGRIFQDGSSIDPWSGTPLPSGALLHGEVDVPGKALDFSFTSFAVPIARTEIASLIASISGADVQRLPIVFDDNDEFEVLNSVRVIACLDEKESEFIKWTEKDHRSDLAGQYRMVTRLKVMPDRIPPDAHFFRIEGWEIALIVSQSVKVAMENAGCHGAAFYEV